MNKQQKEVLQHHLKSEKQVIEQLKNVYNQAAKDCEDKIKLLASRTDLENLQSVIYQKQYQKALKKQLDGIVDTLHSEEFSSIADYLTQSYENGFIGNLYDLHGQGLPFIFPINQEQIVQAIQTDTKLSKNLYSKLGEDVSTLKKSIQSELSRGIATGSSWLSMAAEIAHGMNSPFDKALNRSILIARTEGHRIQNQSALNCQKTAKDSGADIVKQWDSTLDRRTRPWHQEADGQIVELEEYFSVGGEKMSAPGVGGTAKNVCNCRCCLLQRARWALDEEELNILKERAKAFGLDKTKDFEEFKKKYIDAVTPTTTTAPKPKKEYLTEKKLKQKITDADVHIEELQNQMKNASGDEVKKLQQQMSDIELQKTDWQEKLDKKLVAKEKKKLIKEEKTLQDELSNVEVKTYGGIWKDDVTTADWSKLNISGKKKYYEGKFIIETDPDLVKKYQEFYKQLEELDIEGEKYHDIQSRLKKVQSDLTKLKKNGTLTPLEDAYSQERKDAAYWFKSQKEADDVVRPYAGKVWNDSSSAECRAAYDYTSGSGRFNRPLRGYEGNWNNKKGVGKVDLNYEGRGKAIEDLTKMIDKSSYDFDMWLQRGVETTSGASSFLGISENQLLNASESELEKLLVDKKITDEAFVSCGTMKGTGFSGYIFNIYAPQGTKMMYVEPISQYGGGSGLSWDGVSGQSSFEYEFETIIQRGTEFKVTKIEKAANGNVYFDIDVVGQI